MNRESVEDLVHQSLGRQLRVTCLLGLLFLGVGFVLGHMVAAQHARELSDRWNDRVAELSAQVDRVEAKLQGELHEARSTATEKEAATQQLAVQQASRDRQILEETRRLAKATEDLRRSLIARCIMETEREKNRVLLELQPFVDRHMTLKASDVSVAVNRLVDSQIHHLKTLAQTDQSVDLGVQQVGSTGPVDSTRSEISPVSSSAESGICPPPQLTPLIPAIDRISFPAISEPKPIAPIPPPVEAISLTPVPAIARPPVIAEPAVDASATTAPRLRSPQPVTKTPFFPSPLRPRLFIPAGKPAAAKTAEKPTDPKE